MPSSYTIQDDGEDMMMNHRESDDEANQDQDGNENEQQLPEQDDDDLAPSASMMLVALARASLKHLSNRDGFSLCNESELRRSPATTSKECQDDELNNNNNNTSNHSARSNINSNTSLLEVALHEISSAVDEPLETRLYAALSVLAKALDSKCFVALTDAQVLLCYKLASRAIGLCQLLRMTNRDTSLDPFTKSYEQWMKDDKVKSRREKVREEESRQRLSEEVDLDAEEKGGRKRPSSKGKKQRSAETKKKKRKQHTNSNSSKFSEEEIVVIESTLKCYLTICLCALGAWDRAKNIGDEIYYQYSKNNKNSNTQQDKKTNSNYSYYDDEDMNNNDDHDDVLHPLEGASPFRDVIAAKMFRVMMRCINQLQDLTIDALSTRKQTFPSPTSSSISKMPSTKNGNYSSASSSIIQEINSTLQHHGKKLLVLSNNNSKTDDYVFDSSMLHITRMALTSAVLCESTETLVRKIREQEAAAEADQRKLFRKLKLSKDPAERKSIQQTAQDIGTVQSNELQKSTAILNKMAKQLWGVICECVFVGVFETNNNNNKISTSHQQAPIVNAGCALTVAECFRCLLIIRSIPSTDESLVGKTNQTARPAGKNESKGAENHPLSGNLLLTVSKSVVAALGDASPWALHISVTAALGLMRYPDLPGPSTPTAWNISPDVLSRQWKPPAALLAKCDQMVEVIGKQHHQSGHNNVSRSNNNMNHSHHHQRHGDGDDDDKIDENWFNDVMEALMILEQVTVQRDRMMLKRNKQEHERLEQNSSSSPPTTSIFDPGEYLGGSAKIACLVDCLENIILNNNSCGDDGATTAATAISSASKINMPPLTSRGNTTTHATSAMGDNNNNNGGVNSYASAAYSLLTVTLPMLSDSVIRDAKRLRILISQRVPEADAVTLDHHRRNSPHSGRRSRSANSARAKRASPNKNNHLHSDPSGVSNMNNKTAPLFSFSQPPKPPKIKIIPSGGVLRNGSQINFKVADLICASGGTSQYELLVAVSSAQQTQQSGGARIFKPAEGDVLNGKFMVELGKYAPGWADVSVLLRQCVDTSTESVSQRKQKKHKEPKKSSDSDDTSSDGSAEEEEDEENEQKTASTSPFGKVLAVASGRYYVVTH